MARHSGRHRRRHRNPDGGKLLWGVAGAAGGFLVTGPVAGMVSSSGPLNYGAQAAVALGGGWLAAKFKEPLGWGFAVGGLASLAIQLYRDYVGGAGVSYYASEPNPLQDFVTGNPLKWPAYGAAPALPAAAPAAGSNGASIANGGKSWGPRFQSRMFNKAA